MVAMDDSQRSAGSAEMVVLKAEFVELPASIVRVRVARWTAFVTIATELAASAIDRWSRGWGFGSARERRPDRLPIVAAVSVDHQIRLPCPRRWFLCWDRVSANRDRERDHRSLSRDADRMNFSLPVVTPRIAVAFGLCFLAMADSPAIQQHGRASRGCR